MPFFFLSLTDPTNNRRHILAKKYVQFSKVSCNTELEAYIIIYEVFHLAIRQQPYRKACHPILEKKLID